jgi:hypothetical protein
MSTTMAASTNTDRRAKDAFDLQDHYYVPAPTTRPLKSVNLREDCAQFTSAVYDQGDTKSCTANATATALWYAQKKSGLHLETFGIAGPSRLFIYWLGRGGYKDESHLIAFPCDQGAGVQEAITGIAACGSCSETDWPFDPKNILVKPCQEAYDRACSSKIKYFYRLDPERLRSNKLRLNAEQKDKLGAVALANLKKCLTEQYPVVFGLWYLLPSSESYDRNQMPWVLKDVWSLPDKKFPRHCFMDDLPEDLKIRNFCGEAISPGHTVLAIGYDDHRQQVLIQNSRGSSWSENGMFWMPYSWITDYAATSDFWTIRSEPIAGEKEQQNIHHEVLGT